MGQSGRLHDWSPGQAILGCWEWNKECFPVLRIWDPLLPTPPVPSEGFRECPGCILSAEQEPHPHPYLLKLAFLVLSTPSRIPDVEVDLSGDPGVRKSQQMERGKPSKKIQKKSVLLLQTHCFLSILLLQFDLYLAPKWLSLSTDLNRSPRLINLQRLIFAPFRGLQRGCLHQRECTSQASGAELKIP